MLIDDGKLELSNLNRQILGWTRDDGRLKTETAAEKLKSFNSNVKVETVSFEVEEENVADVISGADVVVDARDNWRTRFVLNRACVE